MAKLFGKRDEGAAQDAAVSSIPVPPSDSALVIDLPEGQKLVIGKMEEGTVIEVATWRGTGRPDSRTNRLMLGVSFGGPQTPEPAKQEEELNLSNLPAYQKYLYHLKQIFATGMNKVAEVAKNLKPLASQAASRLKRRNSFEVDKSIRELSQNSSTEKDFDIDKWLESVRGNSRISRLTDLEADRGGVTSRSGRKSASPRTQKVSPRTQNSRSKRPATKKKAR